MAASMLISMACSRVGRSRLSISCVWLSAMVLLPFHQRYTGLLFKLRIQCCA
jgi:hypothetical protein